jgi:hypothetical protein
MAGPTPNPFLKAFSFAAVFFIVSIVAILTAWGPSDGYQTGRLVGYLFALTALPAVIAGFFARRAKTIWSSTKIGVVYFIVLIAVGLLLIIGKLPRQ